jgi:hypothetical protein
MRILDGDSTSSIVADHVPLFDAELQTQRPPAAFASPLSDKSEEAARRNCLFANVSPPMKTVSLFGYYMPSYSKANIYGSETSIQPYDLHVDYGAPAMTYTTAFSSVDARGLPVSLNLFAHLPYRFSISPFLFLSVQRALQHHHWSGPQRRRIVQRLPAFDIDLSDPASTTPSGATSTPIGSPARPSSPSLVRWHYL